LQFAELSAENIDTANKIAVSKILSSQPILETVKPARDVIKIEERTFLHAGPPVSWDRMCGPMRGAMIGACIYERLAETPEHAESLLRSGEIKFTPCHHYNAVGPMAGVITPSMPLLVVRNGISKNTAYSNLNEGLGKVLRFGAYSKDVLDRLRWMEEKLAPALRAVIESNSPIDLRIIIARALHMGDECHNRNLASTSVFVTKILSALIKSKIENNLAAEVSNFLVRNDHFFLNLSMAACKVTMDAAHGIKNSTLITAMARNGTDFGIRVSGLDGWFTAKSTEVNGLYFPSYNSSHANPDIGDSSITETCGLGGFAMAAAPAIVQFVGGNPSLAIQYTKEMYNITMAKNPTYTIPILNFLGTPTGIDLRKVLLTGILPVINTGIAHKSPGVGQIGAGITRAPRECFEGAFRKCLEVFK
jgi:hypothetical protein